MVGGKIHFQRPPRLKDLESAIASGVEVIVMPKSCFERLSSRARSLLDNSDVSISIGSARGRPIEINAEKLMAVVELHRDERTFRKIQELTGIPKSTAHYLVKYAGRQKIRKGGKIVYL